MRTVVAVTVLVTLYNNVTPLLPDAFHNPAYVPMNLAAGALLGAFAWRYLGLRAADLGLAGGSLWRGVRWGVGLALVIVVPVYLALLIPATEGFVDDGRSRDLTLLGLLYGALVRIPLGTGLFEEWVFRGVLYGAWQRLRGARAALLVPSAAFGLWHIVPSYQAFEANGQTDIAPLAVGYVILSVVATAIGGVLFALLRRHTGSILAPVLAHALINSLSLTASYLAG